ncbi:MAG TPA: DUF3298 domain-containing protein [Arsenicitalea sp.]|jgi:uncharacterized protein|nr:DUF3298 domain-containing protein [Arsenicitalea sp.]
MFARFGFLLAFALLFMPHAQAASFDCSKAKTTFAKAICTDPDLSKSDDALAKAFADAQVGLSKPAAAAVQAGQGEWQAYVTLACTDDNKPRKRPYDADGLSCLRSEFDNRAAALANSKAIGNYRFYSVDHFSTALDTDAQADSSYSKVGKMSLSVPRIDGGDAVATAFNALMEKTETALAGQKDENGPGSEDIDNLLSVSAANPQRITVSETDSSYGHGAAHGNYGVTYLHFLTGPKRLLAASDVFTGDAWQKKLQDLALAQLKQDQGEDLMLDDPTAIAPLVIDPARWDFSADGLILQFQPYEVAAYAVGAVTATVPWSKLEGDLVPGAKAALGL